MKHVVALGPFIGALDRGTSESGWIINAKALVLVFGQMETNMWVNIETTNDMEMVNLLSRTDLYSRESLKRTNLFLELTPGQTEGSTMARGTTSIVMASALIG